jgi:hypothetical protein
LPSLPSWDSLDDVSYWHNAFNIAGIIVLALLVGTETLAQIYERRETTLAQIAADAAKKEREEKDEREGAQLQQARETAEKANAKAAQLSAQAAEQQERRHLKPGEKDFLVSALSTFVDQKVELWCLVGVLDCNAFAKDFRDVFRRAGWADPRITFGTADYDVNGIEPLVNESLNSQPLATPPIPAARTLAGTLFTLGLVPEARVNTHPSVPIDTILIRIGRKLPTPQ